MFAPYAIAGDRFRAEKARIWSPTGIQALGGASPYDVHPAGRRLATITAVDESEGVANDKVVFFFNFGEHLKKIAPVTKP